MFYISFSPVRPNVLSDSWFQGLGGSEISAGAYFIYQSVLWLICCLCCNILWLHTEVQCFWHSTWLKLPKRHIPETSRSVRQVLSVVWPLLPCKEGHLLLGFMSLVRCSTVQCRLLNQLRHIGQKEGRGLSYGRTCPKDASPVQGSGSKYSLAFDTHF